MLDVRGILLLIGLVSWMEKVCLWDIGCNFWFNGMVLVGLRCIEFVLFIGYSFSELLCKLILLKKLVD